MDDRDLARYREAYQHSLQGSDIEQPSDEKLTALVTGELAGDERERIVLQMLQCPEAIEKHRILEELHEQASERRSTYRGWVQGLGLAATVLLAVAVWVTVPKGWLEAGPESNHRSDTPLTSRPSGNVSLTAAPAEYRWTAEPGARRYRVEIFDDAAESLWQGSWTEETQVSAPAREEMTLRGGARYFWVVEIDGAAARQTLGPYWFRLE